MWVLGRKGDEVKCGCGKRGGACIIQVRCENQNTEGCVLVTITGLCEFFCTHPAAGIICHIR